MSAPRSRRIDSNDPYPTGVSYQDVFDYEREMREKVEDELKTRIEQIEDRLFIIEQCPDFTDQYPELKAAYEKFKEEEAKMETFEALKNSGDNK